MFATFPHMTQKKTNNDGYVYLYIYIKTENEGINVVKC